MLLVPRTREREHMYILDIYIFGGIGDVDPSRTRDAEQPNTSGREGVGVGGT